MPLLPKPPALLKRRNRATTRAVLPTIAEACAHKVPKLPEREKKTERWHPRVTAWWESVWRSPMAAELLDSDLKGGLYVLAELYQDFWTAEGIDVVRMAAEIRQQEARFGLSPVDRRRLQWEIDRGERASERAHMRRGPKLVGKKDTRKVLELVKPA